jgi:hypothetical protein
MKKLILSTKTEFLRTVAGYQIRITVIGKQLGI